MPLTVIVASSYESEMVTAENLDLNESMGLLIDQMVKGKRFVKKHKLSDAPDEMRSAFTARRPTMFNRGGKKASRETVSQGIAAERTRIEEEAKANGTWLKAPNGKATNLTPAQWVDVRLQSFKKWFGDWELAHILQMIEDMAAINVEGNNISRDEAKEIYSALGNGKNKYDNREVRFVNSVLGKMLGHKGFDVTKIVSQLKEIYYNSVPIYSEKEVHREGHKQHPNFAGYHNYLGKIKSDGVEYYVRFTVQEVKANTQTIKKGFVPNELHSTFVSDIEIYNAASTVHTNNRLATNVESSVIRDAKLQQFFETAKAARENSSKVVDENGEPLMVYHGSASTNIDIFDNNLKTKLNSGLKEFGHFFTTNKNLAEYYASIPMTDDAKLEVEQKIDRLEQTLGEVRNNRDYDRIASEIELLKSNGKVYNCFLNIRDMFETDANRQTYYEGRKNIAVPLSYKTATGIDAIEALAGKNTADTSVKKDGFKMSNVLEMSTSLDNPKYNELYDEYGGDTYVVFDAGNIKSATDNNGEYSRENDDIRFMRTISSQDIAAERARIEEEAKANGTWLKAPNGKATNLTPAQWVDVRLQSFKKWFGDWELSYLREFLLNGRAVVQLTGDEFAKKEGGDIKVEVAKYFDEIGNSANSPFGEVVLDNKGIKDDLAHGIGRNKATSFKAIPDILSKGVVILPMGYHKADNKRLSGMIAAPIKIGEVEYIGVVVVRRSKDTNKLYVHEVTLKDKLLENQNANYQNIASSSNQGAIAKVLQNIVTAKPASKVVFTN